MEYLISSIIGYFLGSIPTAFIVLKKTRKIDVLESGSRNVGAMNAYRVSKSKLLALLVMIIDILKGALSVFLTILLFGEIFILPALTSIFAVLGHCYSPWLKFKGGRGLATAAGACLIILPYLLVIWGVLWLIFYLLKKNFHFSNIAASIMSVMLFFNSVDIVVKYTYPQPLNVSELILFIVSGMMIILIRHIEPLRELIYEKKIFNVRRDND